MKIPPSRDIQKKYHDVLNGSKITSKIIKPTTGYLIFQKEDILKTTNMLTRLFRAIFVKENITQQFLSYKYELYLTNVLQQLPSTICTSKSNLFAMITRDSISFKKFYDVVHNVLGYDLDLTISLTPLGENEGEPSELNYTEMVADVINQVF